MTIESFYVTTPIYYVNDSPHIGHAYTTILADVLARSNRLLGRPTHFLTGTDEHGQKVSQAAESNGVAPVEQCDRMVVRFQQLWERLGITHDDFIRTTEARHKRVVQAVLQDLYDRGEIYSSAYEGWYCVPCERFYTEKDLVEGNCPECGRPVEQLEEQNYFFRMSGYREWLISYIASHPEFIQPEHRRQETLGFLRQPLGDLCISRPKSRLAWGIELPFDADYVTYVWFDALVNYISAIGYGVDDSGFDKWWPASYHLIGKDILTTHTVYWPTMLKAIGIEMPRTVFAHGWWLTGQSKMSKSVGNVVNPMDMVEKYGVDAFRYFLIAEMTLGQDASFTERSFATRYNADLANSLGNMASRVIKMIVRNLDGRVPSVPEFGSDEESLIEACSDAVASVECHLQAMQLNRGIADVCGAVREGNRYFDRMAPWKLSGRENTDDLSRILYSASECLRIVSGLLFPIMPEKMGDLRRSLGLFPEEIDPSFDALAEWGRLTPGREVVDTGALFPRAEVPESAASKQDRGAEGRSASAGENGPGKSEPPAGVSFIDISTFAEVELKTAKVLAAEAVEGADKLLKLRVEIGDERRQVVAGIAEHYDKDDLPGRSIIVVTNLKPVTLFGEESNGMLLAAKHGETLRLLTVDGEISSGAEVS